MLDVNGLTISFEVFLGDVLEWWFPFPLNTVLLTKIEILLLHKLSTIDDSQMERPAVGDRKLNDG